MAAIAVVTKPSSSSHNRNGETGGVVLHPHEHPLSHYHGMHLHGSAQLEAQAQAHTQSSDSKNDCLLSQLLTSAARSSATSLLLAAATTTAAAATTAATAASLSLAFDPDTAADLLCTAARHGDIAKLKWGLTQQVPQIAFAVALAGSGAGTPAQASQQPTAPVTHFIHFGVASASVSPSIAGAGDVVTTLLARMLLVAANSGQLAIVQFLLSVAKTLGCDIANDAPPSATQVTSTACSSSAGSRSALYLACAGGHKQVVAELLSAGAKPNTAASTSQRWTPLHVCAFEGRLACAELLLAHPDTLVDATDKSGWTPLHWAAFLNQQSLAALLLAHKASPAAVNADGDTPLHKTATHASTAISSLLLARGASLDVYNNQGLVPLHIAARAGRALQIALFCKHGLNPDARVRL
ncbi:hypothetical protein CAOG_08604 [Capsaspora owczarzaki ATCC 30864]|uniref:hypothetical protein n=1 Tax=Capsaspora owczarzaki (strain ATCC 30864) TaxID=595528 RepID=UPI0001FE4ECE|nr:hypothetical protein CAOG_08604 [Capsaspora owczarzaki ATCC 30864]|eukprot:XP_011270204.1 hypothetical protein CAOG_08604 [Capsaspora owczarzaki ATCC 30864]